MICNECETVAHCSKHGCIPKQSDYKGAIEVSVIFHEGQRMFAVPKQPAQQQEPVAWKHDCAALLTNDVELWIDQCPHCGKPRTSPPAQQEPVAFITPLMEQQMFDDWCPYKGNPDPRVVWAAAVDAVNGLLLGATPQPAQQQEPVAWVPYLSDRADGVKGHYAIARWNPRGYREVWNLRRHEWGAYSDDVLSLEEADTLLRLITIPTRKVTSPQPAPVQQEPVALEMNGKQLTLGEALDEAIAATERGTAKRLNAVLVAAKNALYTAAAQQEPVAWMDASGDIYKHELWPDWNPPHTPLYTSPPAQRTWVGLTDDEVIDIAGSFDFRYGVARAAEAKLKEKNT